MHDFYPLTLPDDSEVSELTIVALGAGKRRQAAARLIEYSQEGGMWHAPVELKEPNKDAPTEQEAELIVFYADDLSVTGIWGRVSRNQGFSRLTWIKSLF